jgi:hypothetical protein
MEKIREEQRRGAVGTQPETGPMVTAGLITVYPSMLYILTAERFIG